MAPLLKTQIHAYLHDYKKRVFELEHDPKLVAARTDHVQRIVKEILGEKSHYHFHQKVDPSNAAMLDLIYDFCHEAMLPPVVTRLAERIAALESRQQASIDLVTRLLEGLSSESNG